MFALKYDLEIFFSAIILAAAAFIVFNSNHNRKVNLTAPIPNFVSADIAAPISASSLKPGTRTVSWSSPDGNETLIMKINYGIKTSAKTYSFFLSQKTNRGSSNLPFFYETVVNPTAFSIPFNSFSPDGKYFFLQKNTPRKTRYLVFRSSGRPFGNKRYLDVSALFEKYTSNYILHRATGWASDTLLILETQNKRGNPGTSFWFDVTTQSFIPLATRF